MKSPVEDDSTMKRFSQLTWFGLAAALLVACAPPVSPAAAPASTPLPVTPTVLSTPMPELVPSPTSVPAAASLTTQATQTAQQIAADALGVAPDQVKVLAITPVDWPDASLGCPQPGMMYGQVVTPGYQAQVEVDGQVHDVHMDENGHGVVCTTPQ